MSQVVQHGPVPVVAAASLPPLRLQAPRSMASGMRRTPKPFTVEIRQLGEKPKKTTRAARPEPQRTAEVVEVAAEPEFAVPAGVTLTGRTLPALDAPEAIAETPQPTRRGRTAASAWDEDDTREQRQERHAPIAPSDPILVGRNDPEPDEGLGDSEVPRSIDTKTVAATLMLRPGRARVSRDAFRREDRWKARLPAAVHRAGRRRP